MRLLRDLAELRIGFTARGQSDSTGEVYRLLQGRNIGEDGEIYQSSMQSFRSNRDLHLYQIAENNVLVASRGTNRRAHLLRDLRDRTVASSTFYIVRVKTANLKPAYLAWWMNQEEAQRYFDQTLTGSKIAFLTKAALGNLHVPLPPADTQLRIAEIAQLQRQENALVRRLAELRNNLTSAIALKAVTEQG